jgi:hypothetical protein
VSRAAFPNCRLPYLKTSDDGKNLQGGFVAESAGIWTSDPAGAIITDGTFFTTGATPSLKGSAFSSDDTGTYDLAAKRWLPVRRSQVSADGLAYAYAEPYKANPSDQLNSATRVHVVSLGDGSDRVIYAGSPRAVLAYEPEGVYVTSVRYYSGESLGSSLWRLDPATGASNEVRNGTPFRAINHGIAWTDGGRIMPPILTRVDEAAGSQQTWVDVSNQGWIWFVGLESSGLPVVDVIEGFGQSAQQVLFVYTAPQIGTPVAAGTFNQLGVTDSHGTWLSGTDGIYLLLAGLNLVKVSDVTGGNVAGACV